MNKDLPIGVRIISILYIINGVQCLIPGLLLILSYSSGGNRSDRLFEFSNIFYIIGISLVISGIIGIVLGIYLWKGRQWARVFIILSSIYFIIAITVALFTGLDAPGEYILAFVGLIVSLIIGLYLLVNKKVKEYFAKNEFSANTADTNGCTDPFIKSSYKYSKMFWILNNILLFVVLFNLIILFISYMRPLISSSLIYLH